jgi:hypothetical protein
MLRSQHPGRRAAWCRVCASATAPRSLRDDRPSMRTSPVGGRPLCTYADEGAGLRTDPRPMLTNASEALMELCCVSGLRLSGRRDPLPGERGASVRSDNPPALDRSRDPPVGGRHAWRTGGRQLGVLDPPAADCPGWPCPSGSRVRATPGRSRGSTHPDGGPGRATARLSVEASPGGVLCPRRDRWENDLQPEHTKRRRSFAPSAHRPFVDGVSTVTDSIAPAGVGGRGRFPPAPRGLQPPSRFGWVLGPRGLGLARARSRSRLRASAFAGAR